MTTTPDGIIIKYNLNQENDVLHRFIVTYDINGESAPKQEMTYDDADIVATLTRRIKTAFPNASNIQIHRKPEEQLSLTTEPRSKR